MKQDTHSNKTTETNPFLSPYDTPHGVPPFHLIKEEHYKPALIKGMEIENAEIDAIVNNPEPPTFENTLIPLNNSGELLGKVETVMGNLLTACTSDALETLAQEMTPVLSEHNNRIMFNERLFARIKAVKNSKPQLSEEEQTLLDKTYDGFVNRGVGLPEKKKARTAVLAKRPQGHQQVPATRHRPARDQRTA